MYSNSLSAICLLFTFAPYLRYALHGKAMKQQQQSCLCDSRLKRVFELLELIPLTRSEAEGGSHVYSQFFEFSASLLDRFIFGIFFSCIVHML